jgi:hypothetical protein
MRFPIFYILKSINSSKEVLEFTPKKKICGPGRYTQDLMGSLFGLVHLQRPDPNDHTRFVHGPFVSPWTNSPTQWDDPFCFFSVFWAEQAYLSIKFGPSLDRPGHRRGHRWAVRVS